MNEQLQYSVGNEKLYRFIDSAPVFNSPQSGFKNKNGRSQFVASPIVVIIYRSCFLLFYHPIYLDYCDPLKMKIAYRVLIYFNLFQKSFFLTFKKTAINSNTKNLCILPKFLFLIRMSFQKNCINNRKVDHLDKDAS